MILYNLRTNALNLGDFVITKFDDDMNVESSYQLNATNCECPQGHKPTCRHRKMLAAMLRIVDTEFFYCYDNRLYYGAEGGAIAMPEEQTGATARDLRIDGLAGLTTARGSEETVALPKVQDPDEPQRIKRRI